MRARNLKPGFFKNEDLAELNPLTRLLFQGLWCMADREGRLEDRPKRIKVEILPYDNCNITTFLNDLQAKGFILRYSQNNNNYIQITGFKKHQTPHMKEAESIIPAPGEHQANLVLAPGEHGSSPPDCFNLTPESLNLGVVVASPPPDGDNGDARPALPPAFSCPFFEITQERFDELLKDYPGLTTRTLDLELKKIRDYCESNPRKYARDAKGRLSAPGSLIRNWLGRIEIKADRPEMPPPPRSPGPPQGAELRQAKPDCPDCQGQGMTLNPETQRMKICQCWRETPNEQRPSQATAPAGQCPPCES